ncbi:hypothetical protein [Pendulispora albinea]|uniref:Uncharacterized protein n=1 Tax=Pendulispora albinea TaxID=2741071 RepID=A0ABZ2M1X0_9BACT
MLLRDVLPFFATELEELLRADGHHALARACPDLEVAEPCGCGDDFCGGFYTGPRPNGPWGSGHVNVVLRPKVGMVILDVVDGQIRFVEVLYRKDVRDRVDRLFAN